MARSFRSSLALAAVVAVGLEGCKTITEELPTTASETNNPGITVPIPVVVTPITPPKPESPSPTPAPAPNQGEPQSTPTPSPTPAPTGGGGGTVGQSCAPAPAPGNERCPYENSDFAGVVESAYDSLIAAHPNWFNGKGSGATLRISDHEWSWAVVNEIRRKGLCAGIYAEEVSVRNNRSYSENFDVVTSAHTIRRGSGSYRSTCYPASTTAE